MNKDIKIGACVHLVNNFVCSSGKHQNYPCPFRYDFSKCRCFVPFDQEMKNKLETKGYFTYNPKKGELTK